jgi:hypothetical protein
MKLFGAAYGLPWQFEGRLVVIVYDPDDLGRNLPASSRAAALIAAL